MFWFHLGMAVGISGYLWVKRTAADLKGKLTPEALVRSLVNGVRAEVIGVVNIVKSARAEDNSSTV